MKYSLEDFQAEYPTDDACLDKIMEIQFGGKEIVCPSCKKMSHFERVKEKRIYACKSCSHHLCPVTGTVFEKASSTDLKKWFYGVYMMADSGKMITAKELQKQLQVSYKTAWRMAHGLRKLFAASHPKQVPLKIR